MHFVLLPILYPLTNVDLAIGSDFFLFQATWITRCPLLLLDTRMPYGSLNIGCKEYLDPAGTGSFYNEGEADIVTQQVLNLVHCGIYTSFTSLLENCSMFYHPFLFRPCVSPDWLYIRISIDQQIPIVPIFLCLGYGTDKRLKIMIVGVSPTAIVVQSPYIAQVQLLREKLEKYPELSAVEVSTIDSFQGREADAVIISMVSIVAFCSISDSCIIQVWTRFTVAVPIQ